MQEPGPRCRAEGPGLITRAPYMPAAEQALGSACSGGRVSLVIVWVGGAAGRSQAGGEFAVGGRRRAPSGAVPTQAQARLWRCSLPSVDAPRRETEGRTMLGTEVLPGCQPITVADAQTRVFLLPFSFLSRARAKWEIVLRNHVIDSKVTVRLP